jgi:hypothetical protein
MTDTIGVLKKLAARVSIPLTYDAVLKTAERRECMACLPMLCGSRTNTNSGSREALLSIPALTKL